MDLKEGQLDLEELKQLLAQSKRPNVQDLLKKQIRHIEVETQLAQEEQKKIDSQNADKSNTETVKSTENQTTSNLKFLNLQRYTWDQSGQSINVQVYLDNLSEVNPANVQVSFKADSFEIKVLDLKGINYKFSIAKLMNTINPADCKYIIKKSYISIKLKSSKSTTWNSLAYKEDPLSKNKGDADKSADPQESLMNMMKNLYQTGDDKMKETIAKSFQQARSGQGKDPMGGMGGMMGGDFGDDF